MLALEWDSQEPFMVRVCAVRVKSQVGHVGRELLPLTLWLDSPVGCL